MLSFTGLIKMKKSDRYYYSIDTSEVKAVEISKTDEVIIQTHNTKYQCHMKNAKYSRFMVTSSILDF